ncbi:MAG TPA: c-type cytochrome [Myxococcota bacterium]|nr:c-type cytochrome [Myxococcota bacterium]
MTKKYNVHDIYINIPTSSNLIAATGTTGPGYSRDPTPEEAEAATRRGQHALRTYVICRSCHGADLGGNSEGSNVLTGELWAPNITQGRGSVVLEYTAQDWDRVIRHGLHPDGTPSQMPSHDFARLSDQELSDIVMGLRAEPPVDREGRPSRLGPLAVFMRATGIWPLSADLIPDHRAPHAAEPAPAGDVVALGERMATSCRGCHGSDLAGGRTLYFPPDWPVAANLTPHAEGLAGWTYTMFKTVMVDGVAPSGRVRYPMSAIPAYGREMTEDELSALWTYLQQLPPTPDPWLATP